MKGLELSEAYYNEYGRRMIENDFPHLAGFLAAGLCGSGSECFGYDDGVSRDHDFEPGFILFVPDEDVVGRRDFFELERAYSRLPLEFMGLERQKVAPAGGARRGVVRISDFLTAKTGLPRVPENFYEWFSVPEFSLAETVTAFESSFFSGTFSNHAIYSAFSAFTLISAFLEKSSSSFVHFLNL